MRTVGAVLLLVLVAVDWAFNAALAPTLPDTETRTVTYAGAAPTSETVAQLQAALAERDAELALARAQLADQKALGKNVTVVQPVVAVDVDRVESEDLSSSKNWGFTSRTSSVVEDVVVSSEGEESHEHGGAGGDANNVESESTERVNVGAMR